MGGWKKYVRTNIAEMRPVTDDEIVFYETFAFLRDADGNNISISEQDIKNGSPQEGDMIARNPNNHNDKWLVAEDYFKENFKVKGS